MNDDHSAFNVGRIDPATIGVQGVVVEQGSGLILGIADLEEGEFRARNRGKGVADIGAGILLS